MTSGAIQHGVPTNVFLTLLRVTSPPVAKKALTPKSGRKGGAGGGGEKRKGQMNYELPVPKQKQFFFN